ncbi:hypothetical protein ACFX2J_032322 [Malus domestica]
MAEPGFNGLRAPNLVIYLWYQVEEEERSNKWKYFLENVEKSSQSCSPENSDKEELQVEATEQKEKTVSESGEEGNDKKVVPSAQGSRFTQGLGEVNVG